MSARLLLLNGMPGIGKTTLARHHRDHHPGVLCADADELRALIGGDPLDHAEAARVLTLAMATAHLATGHDVVVPELVARQDQLERFADAAARADAALVHVVLAGEVVESRVPDEALPHLLTYAEGLAAVCRHPATVVLRVPDADVLALAPALGRLAERH